ncbi:MAG: FapA family protein [Sulfuricurvum sp.]|nr:FapA family protein [Sulfuricurvum sp.]
MVDLPHVRVISESSSAIVPFVVRTNNIAKELMQAASMHKVSVHSLDFRLLEVQTLSLMASEVKADSDEWNELSPADINALGNELYLNPKFELKQMYEAEIFSITEVGKLDHIELSIAGNATLCKIYLTIKSGSELIYDDTFEEDFFELIMKKKLRANLMIGIFDSMMHSNLSEFLAKVKVNGLYRVKEQERFVVGEGIEPMPTVDDALIMHYDKKQNGLDEAGRIDYAKRGYIISVVANDLLIEYIKPRKGTSGRNCRGEFITTKEPLIRYEPTFTIGENIQRDENDVRIEFRAKTGGYVTFEGGMYDIKTQMDVTEISFRSTGSIETQLDADVSINVKEKDPLKDAIGTGMEVTVNVINIDGNIGPDAKVTAHKAVVEGQVHNSATITADDLTINVHKGKAYGKEIHVTRLEHGSVEGDHVSVAQATGGIVHAKEIDVELLGSHTKLTASKRIEIQKLQGGENILTIDPLLNESREFLDEEQSLMIEVKKVIHDVAKELSAYEETMTKNQPVYEDIKRKLINYKNNGIKIPIAYAQKYKQFQEFKFKLDALRKEYQDKLDHYAFISGRHRALQDEIFEARVINHDRWHNYNEIIFKLIDPPIDITFFPPDNSVGGIYGLHMSDEGIFSIKVLSK